MSGYEDFAKKITFCRYCGYVEKYSENKRKCPLHASNSVGYIDKEGLEHIKSKNSTVAVQAVFTSGYECEAATYTTVKWLIFENKKWRSKEKLDLARTAVPLLKILERNVSYRLEMKAFLHSVHNVQPSDLTKWKMRVSCASCRHERIEDIVIDSEVSIKIDELHGFSNYVGKCDVCRRTNWIDANPLTATVYSSDGQFAPIFTFRSSGWIPLKIFPSDRWLWSPTPEELPSQVFSLNEVISAPNAFSRLPFDDIDRSIGAVRFQFRNGLTNRIVEVPK